MTLGVFLTQRQLFNYSVTVRMIAVIIFVTDRLRRPEYYDNDINDGSLLMCVRKNSVGNVAPLTVTLSPMPSVLPANTHTRTHTGTHTCFWEVSNPGFTQNARHARVQPKGNLRGVGLLLRRLCEQTLRVLSTCDWIKV